MANEISVNVRLVVNNGNYEDSLSASGRFDQASQAAVAGILDIGTAVQTLAVGDISSLGWAAFRNLSTATAGTAYVALGAYDGTNLHELVSLRRGQPALFPVVSNAVIAAQAYGSSAKVQYIVLSE